MGGAVYYYYSTTQDDIRTLLQTNTVLKENNKILSETNEQNTNTIEDLQLSYETIQQNYDQLQLEFREIRSENNRLRDRLSEHELDALAASKPGLIETIINDASEEALRCFELLSGAPFTEDEINAETPEQFNSECPGLFSTLVYR